MLSRAATSTSRPTTSTSRSRTGSSSRATSPAAALNAILQPFGASGVRFFTNAIDTRTDGVDVTANYRTRPGRRTGAVAVPPRVGARGDERDEDRRDAAAARRVPDDALRPPGGPAPGVRPAEGRRAGDGRLLEGLLRTTVVTGLALRLVLRHRERLGRGAYGPGTSADQTFSATWLVDARDRRTCSATSASPSARRTSATRRRTLTLFVNSNSGINRYPNNSPYGYNGALPLHAVSATGSRRAGAGARARRAGPECPTSRRVPRRRGAGPSSRSAARAAPGRAASPGASRGASLTSQRSSAAVSQPRASKRERSTGRPTARRPLSPT